MSYLCLEKYKFKNVNHQPEPQDKVGVNIAFNLDNKQNVPEDSSSEDSKEGTIKLSRFSSKLSNTMEAPKFKNVQAIMKGFVLELIEHAIKLKDANEDCKQNDNSDGEFEEDEYFKQIEQRRLKMEDNNKFSSYVNNTMTSKFGNKFGEAVKVRIYLFNTSHYMDLYITINDTIKDLKNKILSQIEKEGKHKLRHHIPEAYEIRLVDEDEETPNMEFPAMDDKLNVIKSRNNTMAFVEKINFNPNLDLANNSSILGTVVKDSETVMIVS